MSGPMTGSNTVCGVVATWEILDELADDGEVVGRG